MILKFLIVSLSVSSNVIWQNSLPSLYKDVLICELESKCVNKVVVDASDYELEVIFKLIASSHERSN